jgi:hypothetical protein
MSAVSASWGGPHGPQGALVAGLSAKTAKPNDPAGPRVRRSDSNSQTKGG